MYVFAAIHNVSYVMCLNWADDQSNQITLEERKKYFNFSGRRPASHKFKTLVCIVEEQLKSNQTLTW